MRRLLRSAFAAASLGALAPIVHAQYDPPPMVPPVPPFPDAAPARGFTAALPVTPTPGFTSALPVPAMPAPPLPSATPAVAWEPASGPKPPPVQRVQLAIPTNPTESLAPIAPTLPMPVAPGPIAPALPPGRPDRLPPVLPSKSPGTPVKDDRPKVPPQPALPLIPIAPLSPNPKAPAVATPKPGALPNKPTAPAPRPSTTTSKPTAPPKPDSSPAFPVTESSGPNTAAPRPATGPCPTNRLASVCDPLRVRGWLNGGYVYNTSNPDSKFNGPYNSIDRNAEPMFNQAYLIAERVLPTTGAFSYGWRVDALFGYDHYLGQSRGLEVDRDFGQRWNGQYYGLAIPQAYGEIGNDVITLKLGHFYSPIGYEVLPAVGNFFYSRAYSYQFGQPITHWGGLVTTQLTRHWQVQAGLVNGWDTLVGRANNVNFLGGLKYTPDSNWWWASGAIVLGDEQNNPAGLPFVPGTDGNRTRYSLLFGLTPGGPCGKWEYVFHHHYGWQENGTPQRNFARWYGIDQYLFYRVSKSVRLGTRFEWFRDEDGTRVGLNRPANPNNPPLPGNYFSLTAGVNYSPGANFLLRPEIRWDFTSDTARPAFNDGRKNNQLLLGCDLIWQF